VDLRKLCAGISVYAMLNHWSSNALIPYFCPFRPKSDACFYLHRRRNAEICTIFLFDVLVWIYTNMFSEETNFFSTLSSVYVWSPYTQAHIRMQLKISAFYKSNLLTFKIRITYHMALYFSKHNLSIIFLERGYVDVCWGRLRCINGKLQ